MSTHLHTISRSLFRAPVRHGSGAPVQWGPRWANYIRAESNITTPDDPPTQPLPESHEAGEGQADFSNFVDKNEDVSTSQALIGLGSMFALCFTIYRIGMNGAKTTPPKFTRREFPDFNESMPNWKNATNVNKGSILEE